VATLRRHSALIAVSVVAGGLAVPWEPVGTLLSAAGFGLFAVLGLLVWRWSRLPQLVRPEASAGAESRLVQIATWLALGLAIGVFILAVMRFVIAPFVPAIGSRIAAAGALPVWRRVVIIFVAAVGEELIFRLFVLSAVAALAARLFRRPRNEPTPAIVWTAIGVSAVLFAAAHLPAWSGAGSSSGVALPLLVLTLNGIGGVVLGHTFVHRGIVAAMWVHAGADCAIQLIGPLTG